VQDQGKVCDLFDARTTYLTLCQTHNLQYDTLRRAKHSSMMTLFHLHNPDHPAYPTTCASCQRDVQPGTGYKCESCPEYEVCGNCYAAGAHRQHPHPLVVRCAARCICTLRFGRFCEWRRARCRRFCSCSVKSRGNVFK
jgi:hypothetical protein